MLSDMNELRIMKRPETEILERALFEVKKVLVGQDRMTERLFVCLLARGHCLLEGAPGLAKTLAAETLARTVGGGFARLQRARGCTRCPKPSGTGSS
jgi:MoxR-like ATPase